MSTVAFDGKTMASDSMMSGEWIDQTPIQKVFKIKGKLVGIVGDMSFVNEFLEWVKDEALEYPDKDGEALVYDGEALLLYEGGSSKPIQVLPPYSIGSGSSYAMASMLSDKKAQTAVKVACKLDKDSGGDIQYKRILKKRSPPK